VRAEPDDPRELVRALVRNVWNMQDLSFADDVFPPDWPTGSGLPDGPEGVRAWVRADHESFPDVRYEIEDVIVEGDLAVLRWSASGTQLGAFGPIPPTGRFVSWTGTPHLPDPGWPIRRVLGRSRLPRSAPAARRRTPTPASKRRSDLGEAVSAGLTSLGLQRGRR
jgi:predicted ester cyclase